MKLADFDYDLPEAQIAQTPLAERDASRLLVLGRHTGQVAHQHFLDLPDLLRPSDVLVVNDSKVIPARLRGRKDSGGRAEVLLLERLDGERWRALTRPGLGKGRSVIVGPAGGAHLTAQVEAVLPDGQREVRLTGVGAGADELLWRLGEMPTPPYIHARLQQPERYQTIYAQQEGSVAAPTAGLHFTPRVFAALAGRGISVERLTLHVGLGTFQPVRSDDVAGHHMHEEWFDLPTAVAERLNAVRAAGRRLIAVGTTTTRALESSVDESGRLTPGSRQTELFITPGYQFRAIDGLLTNFHLPRSTLLMLVSAFAGRERVLAAYAEAVRAGYRFYSFGDAMLLL